MDNIVLHAVVGLVTGGFARCKIGSRHLVLRESQKYRGLYSTEYDRYTESPSVERELETFFDWCDYAARYGDPCLWPEAEKQILCELFPVNPEVIAGIRGIE